MVHVTKQTQLSSFIFNSRDETKLTAAYNKFKKQTQIVNLKQTSIQHLHVHFRAQIRKSYKPTPMFRRLQLEAFRTFLF